MPSKDSSRSQILPNLARYRVYSTDRFERFIEKASSEQIASDSRRERTIGFGKRTHAPVLKSFPRTLFVITVSNLSNSSLAELKVCAIPGLPLVTKSIKFLSLSSSTFL